MPEVNGHCNQQALAILKKLAERVSMPPDCRTKIEEGWDIPDVVMRELAMHLARELGRNGSLWWEWLAKQIAGEVVRQEQIAREDRAAMGVLQWLKEKGIQLFAEGTNLWPRPTLTKKQRAEVAKTIMDNKPGLLRMCPFFVDRNAQGPLQKIAAKLTLLAEESSDEHFLEQLEEVAKVLREKVGR